MWCSARIYFGPSSIFNFHKDITKCSNQFKYILYADDSTLSTCVPCANVMDSAELINSELKCLDRWLKSNKISINEDKTKYMLFSYGKDVNFPDISVGNKRINETSVTKFLGIHLDKKLNFVNHIIIITITIWSPPRKAGRKREHSISPKTPTPHNHPWKEEEDKIVGDKKEQIMPTGKHWLCS